MSQYTRELGRIPGREPSVEALRCQIELVQRETAAMLDTIALELNELQRELRAVKSRIEALEQTGGNT